MTDRGTRGQVMRLGPKEARKYLEGLRDLRKPVPELVEVYVKQIRQRLWRMEAL